MSKDSLVYIVDELDSSTHYTFSELCEICRLTESVVAELIDYEVIVADATDECFTVSQLVRLMKAARLQRDLEINTPGVALVIDLLETNKRLERRLMQFEALTTVTIDM